jgi:hypothetical protein
MPHYKAEKKRSKQKKGALGGWLHVKRLGNEDRQTRNKLPDRGDACNV